MDPPGTPLALWVQAGLTAVAAQAGREWRAGPIHRLAISAGRPAALAAKPRDFRPTRPAEAVRQLAGGYHLAGATLIAGRGGDPFDQPSPSRAFAEALQRYDWMADLAEAGEEGARETLRLHLHWRRLFGRWNAFAWSGETLERRTFALACAAARMLPVGSEAEGAIVLADLGRHARALMADGGGPIRAAERAAAVAIAASALAGRSWNALLARALRALDARLEHAVCADGGHATRSPEAGLELLFDLLTLDDALSQLGRSPPRELSRAIDRLTLAVRALTLADGALTAFQGGGEVRRDQVAAVLAHDDGEATTPAVLREVGYQRLDGRALQVAVDAGAPAQGPWSRHATASPGAIEVLIGGRRVIGGPAWSPRLGERPDLRVASAYSTVTLNDASPGYPLGGFAAGVLGPRLIGAAGAVDPGRQETDEAVLLDILHDGWVAAFGLDAHRRLYLDRAADELRGEDRFIPRGRGHGRALIEAAARFHLDPGVRAQPTLDGKSVLLSLGGADGWRLTSDALECVLEPSVRFVGGEARPSQQVVLRTRFRRDSGGRLRWKLGRVDAAGGG